MPPGAALRVSISKPEFQPRTPRALLAVEQLEPLAALELAAQGLEVLAREGAVRAIPAHAPEDRGVGPMIETAACA